VITSAKIDARAIFDHASRFHYAGTVLRMEFQDSTAPTIEPYVVVSSFSSELYMKCIYAMETDGNRTNGHNLRKLFDLLAAETRLELSGSWTAVTHIYNKAYEKFNEPFRLPTDLVRQLDLNGRMFEDMRYFYEGHDCASEWLLSPLPDLLRRLILGRRPEWEEGADLIQGSHHLKTDELDNLSRPIGQWSFIAYGIFRSAHDCQNER
jgi:hypothetical protein